MVHFLKTLLQLQKMGHVGVNTPSPASPPIVSKKSCFISRMVCGFFFNLFCWSSLLYPSLISSEPEKKQTPRRLKNWVLYKLREELRGGGTKKWVACS